MKKITAKFISIILTFSTVGCSALVPWGQYVSITASDPKAEIFVDNQRVGTGHVQVELYRRSQHSVYAIRNGHVVAAPIGNSVSILGYVDVVGGVLFWVPALGIFFPGFVDITPSDIQIQMPSQASPAFRMPR
jgi:hypothetical protein